MAEATYIYFACIIKVPLGPALNRYGITSGVAPVELKNKGVVGRTFLCEANLQ